ncbi:MAG: hypothetical protein LUQ07_04655 [Methanospirillum sp.]|nr:hypothetical protein [Methanospirillum sp.]
MQIKANELKQLVLWSYELTALMPAPRMEREKYTIDSRNKFKSLPEALRQMEDASASVTHFVKSAAYFLTRKEGKGNPQQMMAFTEMLLERVKQLNDGSHEPGWVREQLKYLIGYANWNADAVCAILTASAGDRERGMELIRKMLEAELQVIGATDQVQQVYDLLKGWTKRDGSHQERRPEEQNRDRQQQGRRY